MFRIILVSILALPTLAFAQAPATVPVQGFLTSASGDPIDGTVPIRFAFYDGPSDPTPVFAETQNVVVEGGFFDVSVGDVDPLDLSIFDGGGAAYLGIQVASDAEMSPRVSLGTAPFAAYAERAGDAQTLGGQSPEAFEVPSGAIMLFNRATCPDGWTTYAPARGRAIVGSTGAGVEATVGAPLSNRENRLHTHTVDPGRATTSTAGAHTHRVDPPPTTTSQGSSSTFKLSGGSLTWASEYRHTHQVDIPATTSSSSGAHSHSLDIPATTSSEARTSDVMPYIQLLVCEKL